MEIINKQGTILLKYEYKIVKKTVTRKNKAKTINTMYSVSFPNELAKYMQVVDRKLFFYQGVGGAVYITCRKPARAVYQIIKIQKRNQVSIPRKLMSPEKFDKVEILVDFSQVDEFTGRQGKTKITLK